MYLMSILSGLRLNGYLCLRNSYNNDVIKNIQQYLSLYTCLQMSASENADNTHYHNGHDSDIVILLHFANNILISHGLHVVRNTG